jgi:hypothetical protein
MRPFSRLALAALATAAAATSIAAQQPGNAPAAPPANMPNVGDMAPDFSARGATRFGVLRDPVRLSDYRGQTVVLWLFIKARTRG